MLTRFIFYNNVKLLILIALLWSGREDLNFRPLEPHSSALPDCATPRLRKLSLTCWLIDVNLRFVYWCLEFS